MEAGGARGPRGVVRGGLDHEVDLGLDGFRDLVADDGAGRTLEREHENPAPVALASLLGTGRTDDSCERCTERHHTEDRLYETSHVGHLSTAPRSIRNARRRRQSLGRRGPPVNRRAGPRV